jgi:membrane-associated phospholipid phosphatase
MSAPSPGRADDTLLFGTAPIEAVQQFFGLGHPELFHLVSLPGSVWGMVMALGVAMWLWGRETAYALLGAVILATLTKQVMSLVFSVPRPEGPDIVVYQDIDIGSFPSGHSYVGAATWGMFWALGLMPLWIPLVIAAGVSLARLYLGVHYLADVVTGVVLALPFVLAYRWLWQALRPWLSRPSLSFWRVAALLAVAGSAGGLLMAPDNPRRWEILGFAIGVAVALLAQYRVLSAGAASRCGRRAGALITGLAGTLLMYALATLAGPQAFVVHAVAAAAAALWALLGAPLTFRRLGWAGD